MCKIETYMDTPEGKAMLQRFVERSHELHEEFVESIFKLPHPIEPLSVPWCHSDYNDITETV